jgi:glucan phosphoethanolaminetransferase (alkaline phosphatase superfamily)
MFLCLVPVVGFFPALWTLYKGRGSRQEKAISRLAVTLALGWVIGYFLLNTGAQAAGGSTSLQLLVMSSLLTSGYFLTNIWLMVRLWQRKSVWLPGVSRLGDRLP